MDDCAKDPPAPLGEEPLSFERDAACLSSDEPEPEPERSQDINDVDYSCEDKEVGFIPTDNSDFNESDKHEVSMQTRCDSSTSPERPYSLDKMEPVPPADGYLGPCLDYAEQSRVPCIKIETKEDISSRNPITGLGLNGDGVGGLKPKKLKNREGNPVTGEGYKPGSTDFICPAAVRSAAGNRQVINKNRVPPGGYSSGLW